MLSAEPILVVNHHRKAKNNPQTIFTKAYIFDDRKLVIIISVSYICKDNAF